MTETDDGARIDAIVRRLEAALDELYRARPLAKELHRNPVIELALRLVKQPGGVPALYELAPRFEPAGVFLGGDWNQPAALEPRLVSSSLQGPVLNVTIESMSLLRMLAIAEGTAQHDEMGADEARSFVVEVVALNLDRVLGDGARRDEEAPGDQVREGVRQLLGFLMERVGARRVLGRLVDEADRILGQRPIVVRHVREMLEVAGRAVAAQSELEPPARLQELLDAVYGPTDRSRTSREPGAYAEALRGLDETALLAEARAMATAMRSTGLVCPQHAVLLRHLTSAPREHVALALGLDAVGVQSLGCYEQLTRALIERAIHPSTAQAVYGLAAALERGVLFLEPVARGLWRLMDIPLHEDAESALQLGVAAPEDPHAALLAGTLEVLGQPLGVGQGNNPSCQSARAISLWSQSDPGFLLACIASVARDGEVALHFEGEIITSRGLPAGLIQSLHTELDPISLLLVPHLDRIYAEMGRRVYDRGEDGHRWVNPELHGWWVHRGFATTIEYATGAIAGFRAFARLFYATYHPYHNGNRPLVYPQPAGIAATDSHGRLLGWHAIAIERVGVDPAAQMRVYFYNPNNDGGQRWGDVFTSTSGHSERPGESSLPFEQFAAHLYVFHHDPRDQGDPASVPEEELDRVEAIVRAGWGRQLVWKD